jgi:hypothetical protein
MIKTTIFANVILQGGIIEEEENGQEQSKNGKKKLEKY